MHCYLLTIGDEILIGQITDTNSAWMSRELNACGIRVVGKSSVGDTAIAIREGIAYAAQHADIVLMTGGLGPTKDDITKKTLAQLFNSDMELHEPTLERIKGYFQRINRPLPHSMYDQATLPVKATILTNKMGTAPGMWLEQGGKIYISLPGVPFEMEYLMTAEVMPRLVAQFQPRPIVHRTILTSREGESNIAKRIEMFEDTLPSHVKLAYLPGMGEVRLRLTGVWPGEIIPDAADVLTREMDQLQQQLTDLIPDLIYGYEQDSLPIVIGRLLSERSLTLATAESCTGGYIAHQITAVSGSSAYFEGSVITYSNDLKMSLLGVKMETLGTHGAVSEATVREMCSGARERLGTDFALAVTGIAGPNGGTPEKPVGTIWVGIAGPNGVATEKLTFSRDRLKNIHLTSVYALSFLRQILLTM
jgi:nicotinamide-nucleotide amidase